MSMRMSRRRFEELALLAYSGLPPAIVDRLENLDIIVEDTPGPEADDALAGDALAHDALADDANRNNGNDRSNPGDCCHDHSHSESLLGLYIGIPLTERYGDGPAMPDCIYIYRRPILAMCNNPDEVAAEVRTTLWHEVGHYLGMDEHDLERLGYA